jgi:GNAT superfamily N-acetyltransferase
MEPEFRDVRATDYASRFGVDLANLFASHPEMELWECVHESQVVGHCNANRSTGEITGLQVIHSYRRRGIGKRVLALVVSRLQAAGMQRVWLSLPREPRPPAYDFFLAVGWRPTGERTAQGDDILEPGKGGVR